MASVTEYLEKLNTPLLEFLLAEYCAGRENLTAEHVVIICRILARRNPRLPLVEEAMKELCRIYLPR